MQNNELKIIKNILSVFLAIFLAYLVSVMASMLIPLALALFIAILLQPILSWFERKKVSFGLSLAIISVSTLSALALIGMLMYQTGRNMLKQKEKILSQVGHKITDLLVWFQDKTGIEIAPEDIVGRISKLISTDWLIQSTGSLADSLGHFSSLFFMTSLYLLALLTGILQYEKYIHYLEDHQRDPEGKIDPQESKLLKGFEEVKQSIATYMKIKFLMSLLIGFIYWIICLVFGIDFALFWGFFAFILNFIPVVGAIVGTVPPLLMGLVQIESLGTLVFMVSLLLVLRNLVDNILETKLMGSSLSLNMVTVILGLVLWGNLWGATGMILSVPLLVLTKVILSQIEDAKMMVKLMGTGVS